MQYLLVIQILLSAFQCDAHEKLLMLWGPLCGHNLLCLGFQALHRTREEQKHDKDEAAENEQQQRPASMCLIRATDISIYISNLISGRMNTCIVFSWLLGGLVGWTAGLTSVGTSGRLLRGNFWKDSV